MYNITDAWRPTHGRAEADAGCRTSGRPSDARARVTCKTRGRRAVRGASSVPGRVGSSQVLGLTVAIEAAEAHDRGSRDVRSALRGVRLQAASPQAATLTRPPVALRRTRHASPLCLTFRRLPSVASGKPQHSDSGVFNRAGSTLAEACFGLENGVHPTGYVAEAAKAGKPSTKPVVKSALATHVEANPSGVAKPSSIDLAQGTVERTSRLSELQVRITDPNRMLAPGGKTSMTREQVARFRGAGRERGRVFNQHLAEAHRGRPESSRMTPLGKRVHDVGDIPTGTRTEMAVEGKNYLRFRRVGGRTIRGEVPLTEQLRLQIHKDVLWMREGRQVGVERLIQWEFAGAPPSGELALLLQHWGIPYVQ